MSIQKKQWSELYSKDLTKCQCSLTIKDEDYPINVKSISYNESIEKQAVSDGANTITGSYIIVKNNTDQELTFTILIFLLEKEVADILNKTFENDSEEEIVFNVFNTANKKNQAINCYLKKLVIQESIEMGGTNNVNTTLQLGTMDRKAIYDL